MLLSPAMAGVLLLLLSLLYGIATIAENMYGSGFAREWFYNSSLSYFLIALGLLNMIRAVAGGGYPGRRKAGMATLHISLLVIVVGALISHLHGFEGTMRIREGETSELIILNGENRGFRKLPFSVTLNSFDLKRYPGSNTPSSYESDISLKSGDSSRNRILSMNKVVSISGYRLFQSSFDPDEKGSEIIVNYDPVGMMVSYTGYCMLFLGVILIFTTKGSRFGRLRRKLAQISATAIVLLMPQGAMAENRWYESLSMDEIVDKIVPASHSEDVGRLNVQCYSGRTEPVNTYASKLMRKIYGRDSNCPFMAEQIILGIITFPDYWSGVPLIMQPSPAVAGIIGNEAEYLSFNSVFDESGNYILYPYIEQIYSKPAMQRTKTDKEILKLDERVNIFYSLLNGEMFALFPLPGAENNKWFSGNDDFSQIRSGDTTLLRGLYHSYISGLREGIESGSMEHADGLLSSIVDYQRSNGKEFYISDSRVRAEGLYNRIDVFGRIYIFYLAFSTLLLFASMINLVCANRVCLVIGKCMLALMSVAFIAHSLAIAMRWYISGQAPWANSYESMVYVAWAVLLSGLLFSKRSKLACGLSGFMAGLIMLVCNLNFMDPEITPLAPVLKSPWLMFHVAVIMASYGFFGMSFLISFFSVVCDLFRPGRHLKRKLQELRIINEISLIAGTCLLSAGIFLGAIWANESWGRYWGWDPKEVWALITMLVYTLIIHSHRVAWMRNDLVFNTMVVYGFTAVLMTYFGVNHFLSGLHSYGNTGESGIIDVICYTYIGITMIVSMAWISSFYFLRTPTDNYSLNKIPPGGG